MAAHLTEESQLAGLPGLRPTLVRWAPPAGARPHLSVGIERLEQVSRSETVLVVSPESAPAPLLDRISDARKAGAALFALDQGDEELDSLVHESLALTPGVAPMSFDAAQHLVSFAAVDPDLEEAAGAWAVSPGGVAVPGRLHGAAGLRTRLSRLLGAISGPQPD